MGCLAALRAPAASPRVSLAEAAVGQLMLTFLLAMAAVGLVLTALTHAELRRPASSEVKGSTPKRSNVPTGLRLFIWFLVTAIVILLLIGVVGWIVDFFR